MLRLSVGPCSGEGSGRRVGLLCWGQWLRRPSVPRVAGGRGGGVDFLEQQGEWDSKWGMERRWGRQ